MSNMRKLSFKYLLLLVLCSFVYFVIRYKYLDNNHKPMNWKYWIPSTQESLQSPKIVLSFVVCESRLNESLNVVKSVLIFTKSPIHLVIFVDDIRRLQLNETLSRWQTITANQFQFELHNISFPEPEADYWLNLFKKCAAQRLFFPKLLPHIDSLIYVDTDTLFLGPIEELWAKFGQFNSSQVAGQAWEDINPNTDWYPRFAQHPYYGQYGLNSGVMLMNLTRMRDFGWMEYLTPVVHTWRNNIPWGDQDIINIILSGRPSAVFVLHCRYNYRHDQCENGDSCEGALARGVFLLHGSRVSFHGDKQPAFRACYDAISEHQLGSDPRLVLSRLEEYLSRAPPSPCGALKQAYLKVPTDTLNPLYESTSKLNR